MSSFNKPYAIALKATKHRQTSSFYIPLSIAISVLENSVILIARKKETSLHPPSKLLLFNPVSTNFGIGIVVQPLCLIQYLMSIAYKHWEICRLTEMFSYMPVFILCYILFLTVTKRRQITCTLEDCDTDKLLL